MTAPEQHEKDTNTRRPERAWCIRRAVREEPSVAVGQDTRSGGTGYEVLSDTENYGRYSAGLTQLDLCFLKDKGQMGGGGQVGDPACHQSICGEVYQLCIDLPHQEGAAGHNPCLPSWGKEGQGG